LVDERAEADAEMLQDVISKVRNIRSEMNVDAKRPMSVRIASTDARVGQLLSDSRDYIFRLATVNQLEVVPQLSGDKLAAQAVAAGCALEVPLAGIIDFDAERARLQKEMDKVQREIDTLDRKLSNASFVERAPADVVEENRRRLQDYRDQAMKLQAGLERLH
jgi:valyl-tRNA synthetase